MNAQCSGPGAGKGSEQRGERICHDVGNGSSSSGAFRFEREAVHTLGVIRKF